MGELVVGLQENLIKFSRGLRKEGLRVTVSEALDGAKALEKVDLLDREEFYYALRTTMAKKLEDIPIFDKLFNRFWTTFQELMKEGGEGLEKKTSKDHDEDSLESSRWRSEDSEGKDEGEENETKSPPLAVSVYSPIETRGSRAFKIAEDTAGEAKRVIRRLKRRLATMPGRRAALSLKGEVDFRRTIRKNLTYGGEILYPVFRRKKTSRLRAVVLCDVSGSMDSYSEYFLKTLYHIRNTIRGSEIFVFSTELVKLTEGLAQGPLEEVANRISSMVEVWGSGTKIGYCMNIFKERYGNLVDRRTIIIIISDGWDVGDISLLEENLRWAKSRAAGVVWLNPLLDNPEYQVLTLGMKVALPYIDIFASSSIFKNIRLYERYFGKSVQPRFRSNT